MDSPPMVPLGVFSLYDRPLEVGDERISMLFDTHCHLSDERLWPERVAVLERAAQAGVGALLSVAVDLEDSASLLDFVASRAGEHDPAVHISAGVHPASAASWNESSNARLEEMLKSPEVIAVGECGLDWHYDESHPDHPGAARSLQIEVFEAQLALAARANKPVVVHNRDADAEVLLAIERTSGLERGGVLHCFSSGINTARRALDLGFHLGFGGIVTFKNADAVREAARFCPADRLLIETDAPYLAPVPHRGKRNEPAFVAHTARALAATRGQSDEELAQLSTANARRLFGLTGATR